VTADREVLPWALFGSAADELAAGVAADGFAPDLILAVARGGLFVAGALGYALSVKNVAVMNVEFYTGVDQRLDVPVVLPPEPDGTDVLAALTRLGVDARAVVVCRVLFGLSTAETADVLHVAEGTVRSRLSRAMTVLRRELSEENR